MSCRSRIASLALAIIAGAGVWQDGVAQQYPTRPVRIILPFPPGSPTDSLLRALGQELTKSWGQAVIVDNRPGGEGIIAAEVCKNSPADAHNFCLFDRRINALPYLRKKLPFELAKDFEPVTNLIFATLAMVAHPSVGANSMPQLIAAAKARSGQLNFGSLGVGTLTHLYLEWMKKQYGVQITHVPYKGPPALTQALLSGEIHATYLFLANFVSHIRAANLRALGVSGRTRSPLVPDVPTMEEQGFGGLDDRVWFGLFAPAGTPKSLIGRFQKQVERIFAVPAFRERYLSDQGLEPVADAPEAFASFVASDLKAVAELVRISGAQPE